MSNVDECAQKIKPAQELPKGPSQGVEAMLRARNRIPGLAPGSNGTGGLPLFSPNGHGAGPKVPPKPESQETAQDPTAFGVEQEWKICDLKQHPKQEDYFPDESEEADSELEADMKVNGQRDPIYILRDGTILGGHRRVKMAKRLGWKTIKVIVYDLDDEEGEALFLDDNYLGRQLSDLQKVRCAVRKVELAKRGKAVLPPEVNALKKTRDKIGKLLGGCGRNVDRYLLVLKAPKEVQHACDKGYLTLAEAGQVAKLAQKVQERIAAEIKQKGLKAAKAIVKPYLPGKAETRRGAESLWYELRRGMGKAIAELPGHEDQLWLKQDDLELIEKAERLLKVLKAKAVKDIEAAEEDARWDTEELAHHDRNADVQDGEPGDILSTREGR
jgi:ParB-like chromosome segregation protein Spo0J